MARQIKIKDIAKMAGVSSGTVDRVLHNRGGVSESSKKAVERILAEVGYRYNIHTSAVSLTKEFNLVITCPLRAEFRVSTGVQSCPELNMLSMNSMISISIASRHYTISSMSILAVLLSTVFCRCRLML